MNHLYNFEIGYLKQSLIYILFFFKKFLNLNNFFLILDLELLHL